MGLLGLLYIALLAPRSMRIVLDKNLRATEHREIDREREKDREGERERSLQVVNG